MSSSDSGVAQHARQCRRVAGRAWTDRLRRRGVLIWADLAWALLLVSVPVGAWLGVLTMGQLYAVVLLPGTSSRW